LWGYKKEGPTQLQVLRQYDLDSIYEKIKKKMMAPEDVNILLTQ